MKLALIAALGVANLALLVGAHWSGRLVAAKNCAEAKVDAAGEAIDEQAADEQDQQEFAAKSEAEYKADVASRDAIIRSLRRADDGDVCNDADDGQRVWDGWNLIFEEEVHSGSELDG